MKKSRVNFIFIAALVLLCACKSKSSKNYNYNQAYYFKKGSFGYDLDFLKKKDSIVLLKSNDGLSEVIVSQKYQGKVFTSTANGEEGSYSQAAHLHPQFWEHGSVVHRQDRNTYT